MEIKNQALLKMKEMAEKAKKNKTENELPKTFEISNPVVDINKSEKGLAEFKPASLSLDLDEKVSKEIIMSNVKIPTRNLSASEEDILKAKRKVGRLTTGASAAVPLICRGPTCPFKAKCVDEDTLILTSFGFQPIKNLKPLDRIYSVNEEGLLEKDVINDVWKSGVKETFKIKTKYNLELTLTKDHPILTCDENYGRIYKTIEQGLSVGDVVFITDTDLEIMVDTLNYGDLYEDTIVSIEEAGLKEVYDLNIKKNHNFIGNGILVHNCSYYAINVHEVGENCLMEEQLIEYWTQKYIDELEIDYNSISEMHFVSRLVEIAIMDLRMTNYISINDQDLMMEFIASVDPEGSVLTNKGISVAFEVKERLEKQKLKILDILNSTRDKKAKLFLHANDTEKSSRDRALLDKLETIASKLTTMKDVNSGVVIDL